MQSPTDEPTVVTTEYGGYFRVGDVIRNKETGEEITVTSVPAGPSIALVLPNDGSDAYWQRIYADGRTERFDPAAADAV